MNPVIASAANTTFVTTWNANIQVRSFRRSTRSASRPENGGMKNKGAIAAKVTNPTNPDESERLNTRVPLATISAQAAAPADIVPIHIRR